MKSSLGALPRSQLVPSKPLRQEHAYPRAEPTALLQAPPFKHGLLAHGPEEQVKT